MTSSADTEAEAESEETAAVARPDLAPERDAEIAHDTATADSPWHVTTPDGQPVTVLGDAGAGDWNLACPNCGTYIGCVRLGSREGIRGIEMPCTGCTGLLLAETTAAWPLRAGRDIPRETLRDAVRWGVFDAAPPEQTSRVDPGDPAREANTVLLDGPNQRWTWFRLPKTTVTADPGRLTATVEEVSIE